MKSRDATSQRRWPLAFAFPPTGGACGGDFPAFLLFGRSFYHTIGLRQSFSGVPRIQDGDGVESDGILLRHKTPYLPYP